MVDKYGNKAEYLMQAEYMYSVPNYGQLPRNFMEQCFYVYKVLLGSGVETGISVTLDPCQADTFREYNNLKAITFLEQNNLLS
jgi:hypothetical protein